MFHDGRAQALVLEDHPMVGTVVRQFLEAAGLRVHLVHNEGEARAYLRASLLGSRPVDLITTDMMHPGGSGIWFIRDVRALSDEHLLPGGLRARHIPLVLFSQFAADPAYRAAVAEVDRRIGAVPKDPEGPEALVATVDSVMGAYRHAVLEELQTIGVGVAWDSGRFRVVGAFRHSPDAVLESSLFSGTPGTVAGAHQRLVLMSDRTSPADAALQHLEALLNDPLTTERDLQAVFEAHPGLLMGDDFESYWAEPSLPGGGGGIRPDFVLRPSHARRGGGWQLVDLKSPRAPLLVSSRFHQDLSAHVYRVATQLRDYGNYFADPRNAPALRRRFDGVVPRPRLVAVIGRSPTRDRERFAELRMRMPDVRITTYDEIVELRRARVGVRRV